MLLYCGYRVCICGSDLLRSGCGFGLMIYPNTSGENNNFIEDGKHRMSENTHRAAVLSSAGRVSGIVGEDILVLSNMRLEHLPTITDDVCGIVAEVGGVIAHLVIMCREKGKTIMILPDACSLLKRGMAVTLLPAQHQIRVDIPQVIDLQW